jgi:hypothetical protein
MMGGKIPSCRSEAGQWKTVTHEQYGFSVDYPAIWRYQKFGDAGYKGADDLKLMISDSLMGEFSIQFYYRAAVEPTLDDVVNWAEARLNRFNKLEEYEDVFLILDTIDGLPRHRYKFYGSLHEEVYIIRENDMFIIELNIPAHAKEYAYDNYFDYFDQIIASFRPMQ